MIDNITIEPVSDSILLGAYIVTVDLSGDLYFKFEDWREAKFGIFFFDDIGLGIPIFSMGYCLNLSDTVLQYGNTDTVSSSKISSIPEGE